MISKNNSKVLTGFFAHFKGDLFGGLTAGIVALPLALAFGVQSGLGASAGLFGAIFIGFFASLFGGTPSQISGPTAPMTAVSMLIIAGIIQDNNGVVEKALPYILIVFLMAGLFQIGFGFLKVGSLIKYIPYPVVSGFMTGIGVIILVTQVPILLGYNATNDAANIEKFKPHAEELLLDKILMDEANEGLLVLEDFKETVKRGEAITEADIQLEAATLVGTDSGGVLGALKYTGKALSNINWLELILALLTIGIIYGFKNITKAVPSTLVALLLVSVSVVLLGLDARTIGQIPSGFPKFHMDIFSKFSLGQISPYIFIAISLAFLGAIDSLLTSVVADNMTRTKHDSNKELIGQGIGNSIAALFGGIPGAGATIRTVVNINSGGKTKLSGMFAATLLLVILLVLGPFAAQIPKAVLAGILITVGFGVMDYKGLRALKSMPASDTLVLILVLVLTVFWDLIFAVAIGLVVSSLFFMKKMADITATDSKLFSLTDKMPENREGKLPKRFKEEVFVKEVNGPIFFGYTSDFKQLGSTIPKTASTVVFRMNRVPYIDKSGLNAIEDLMLELVTEDKTLLIVGLNEQPRYMLETIGIIPQFVKEEHLFSSYTECIDWVISNVKDEVA